MGNCFHPDAAEEQPEFGTQPCRVVAPKSMGPLLRLFGSKGIDGDGTEFELENIDPFLLCDFVDIPIDLNEPPFRPPFCAHPHAGNSVASLLLEGEDMAAWDNIQGFEKEPIRAGGVYVVCTGGGCVHDETNEPVVIKRTIRRAPWGRSGDEQPGARFRFFQLWFDPGHVYAVDGPPPVSSQVVQPEAVPMITAGAMRVRVLLGLYDGKCGVDLPVTVLHCSLLPFTGEGILRIPKRSQGFIFAVERQVRVVIGEETHIIPAKQELVVSTSLEEDCEVKIEVDIAQGASPHEARADDALEILVGFGPPICKPFYKLLGYGGALIASSEEKVRTLMAEYERDPKNFGIPPGSSAADTSRYGLQEGYKGPMDGKGECQRGDLAAPAPQARFYVKERGPYQPKGSGKGPGK